MNQKEKMTQDRRRASEGLSGGGSFRVAGNCEPEPVVGLLPPAVTSLESDDTDDTASLAMSTSPKV